MQGHDASHDDHALRPADGDAGVGAADQGTPAERPAPATPADDAASDAVTFYWRPGCGFCSMLRSGLRRRGVPLDERNIWEDADAAAAVRAVARGNETVPTVVVDGVALVNPRPAQVVALLQACAPHLLPDDPPAATGVGGALRRLVGR